MRIVIVCGHYGTGKTNFSLNFARNHAATPGLRVVVVDMDIVNPYFRSSDYTDFLRGRGIDTIAPPAAGSTLDAPYLSAEIGKIFSNAYDLAVIDAGGDDAGATALGGYSKQIAQNGYEMLYVINRNRPLAANPADAVGILREIETASRLKATAVVNNTHLGPQTTVDDILDSFSYAQQVCKLAGLPLFGHTAPVFLADQLAEQTDIIPVDILVRPPWLEDARR